MQKYLAANIKYLFTKELILREIDKYKAHSINKVNFVEGVGNRKHCLQFILFQGNQ